jgi:carbamoyltransferase
MNVKANKLISELSELDDLFVFPSCGDETNAIGAAWWVEANEGTGGGHIPPLGHVYWGPAYGDAAVDEALARNPGRDRWVITREDDIDSRVADLLAAGEVVARCTGRAEFGARALGNRSILADPTQNEVVRQINDMIKSRDFWMPFAPALLAARADDYIVNPKGLQAPYMILAFDTTARVDELKAAIHPYDLTARPQVVYEDWNPGLHRILSEFERRTGRGAILNTSFNLHGSPIVNTPAEALEVFSESGLRHLALNDYLVSKRSDEPVIAAIGREQGEAAAGSRS